MDLQFIVPGHYISKLSDINNKESAADIIRVLGEDPNKPDFFLLQNGGSMHEQSILSQYKLMDNVPTKKNGNIGKLIMGDVEAMPKIIEPTIVHERPKFKSSIEENYLTAVSEPIKPNEPQHTEEEIFILSILNKIKQTQTNKLSITLEFEIPYDTNKLRESVNMFNLNIDIVSNLLLSNIDLNNPIIDGLRKYIIDEPKIEQKIIQSDIETKQTVVVSEPVIVQSTPENINTEIIDEMEEINNRFSKISASYWDK